MVYYGLQAWCRFNSVRSLRNARRYIALGHHSLELKSGLGHFLAVNETSILKGLKSWNKKQQNSTSIVGPTVALYGTNNDETCNCDTSTVATALGAIRQNLNEWDIMLRYFKLAANIQCIRLFK